MSDTPRTDNELHELSYYETRRGRKYEEHFPYIEPEFARTLERELAAVTAERDEAVAWIRVVGEEVAIAGHRHGDRDETLAGLRCLRADRDRMRTVVEAVLECACIEYPDKLMQAMRDYEKGMR